MGSLLKDVPFSEVVATLEVLAQHGVGRDELAKLRKNAELARKLAALLGTTAPAFYRDMTREGWKLLEHTPRTIYSSLVTDLELVQFPNSDKAWINGEERVRRAKELNANLCQEDAEWLFQHQNKIPAEWKEYYLIFPGTVWREDSHGHRYVPWLGFGSCRQRWELSFHCLELDWRSDNRLLRLRK